MVSLSEEDRIDEVATHVFPQLGARHSYLEGDRAIGKLSAQPSSLTKTKLVKHSRSQSRVDPTVAGKRRRVGERLLALCTHVRSLSSAKMEAKDQMRR